MRQFYEPLCGASYISARGGDGEGGGGLGDGGGGDGERDGEGDEGDGDNGDEDGGGCLSIRCVFNVAVGCLSSQT